LYTRETDGGKRTGETLHTITNYYYYYYNTI
jgi:hypothetical protein